MHGKPGSRRCRQRQPRKRPTPRSEQHTNGLCERSPHGGRRCPVAGAVHQVRTRSAKTWENRRQEVEREQPGFYAPVKAPESRKIQPDFVVNIILLIGRIVKRNLRLFVSFSVEIWLEPYELRPLPLGGVSRLARGVRQPENMLELGTVSTGFRNGSECRLLALVFRLYEGYFGSHLTPAL